MPSPKVSLSRRVKIDGLSYNEGPEEPDVDFLQRTLMANGAEDDSDDSVWAIDLNASEIDSIDESDQEANAQLDQTTQPNHRPRGETEFLSLRKSILSKYHPSEAVEIFQQPGSALFNQRLFEHLSKFAARRVFRKLYIPLHNDTEMACLYMCKTVVLLARIHRFVNTCHERVIPNLQNVLCLFPGKIWTVPAFDMILTCMLELSKDSSASLVPTRIVKECLRKGSSPSSSERLARFLRPLEGPSGPSKTVFIHLPNSYKCFAICHVTTALEMQRKTTVALKRTNGVPSHLNKVEGYPRHPLRAQMMKHAGTRLRSTNSLPSRCI
ncbi:MAG: hypothetical protein Q9226_004289 [Calogaya cf. arnoldii]